MQRLQVQIDSSQRVIPDSLKRSAASQDAKERTLVSGHFLKENGTAKVSNSAREGVHVSLGGLNKSISSHGDVKCKGGVLNNIFQPNPADVALNLHVLQS